MLGAFPSPLHVVVIHLLLTETISGHCYYYSHLHREKNCKLGNLPNLQGNSQ